jgi:hypothetical protein
MLKEFIGTRTKGLAFHTCTGTQLLQANTLQDSLHPILRTLEHVRVASTFPAVPNHSAQEIRLP